MKDNDLLTDAECRFLLHWHYEATGPFWGPAIIWCVNHRINPAYGPYPLAELFWDQERHANRTFWTGHRPELSFPTPWNSVQQFWDRVNTALSSIPRLQDDPRFIPDAFNLQVHGTLTSAESSFLRAYYLEMTRCGSGPSIDLAHQHGVLGHQLIPFFVLLDGLGRVPTTSIIYPWKDFSARFKELSGRRNDYPRLHRDPW